MAMRIEGRRDRAPGAAAARRDFRAAERQATSSPAHDQNRVRASVGRSSGLELGETYPGGVVEARIFNPQLDSPENRVRALYREFLGREPELDGLAFWAEKLRTGASFEEVRNAIAASDEARARRKPGLAPTGAPPTAPTDGRPTPSGGGQPTPSAGGQPTAPRPGTGHPGGVVRTVVIDPVGESALTRSLIAGEGIPAGIASSVEVIGPGGLRWSALFPIEPVDEGHDDDRPEHPTESGRCRPDCCEPGRLVPASSKPSVECLPADAPAIPPAADNPDPAAPEAGEPEPAAPEAGEPDPAAPKGEIDPVAADTADPEDVAGVKVAA